VTNKAVFEIDTGDSPPVYVPPRKYHPAIQAEIDAKLQQMVNDGILSPITFTRWGSPVRPVTKPDGSMRVCGNYIVLNKITIATKYPFPNLHETLQSLGQVRIFSKLDLASGYYQIPFQESHKEKTALVTVNGAYVFHVMPFGLRNAPATFQALMDQVLGPLRYSCAVAYTDDILIFSADMQQHIKHIHQVLAQLQEANLSIKLSKCAFSMESVEYLGFVVTPNGTMTNPDKIKSVLKYPPPTNASEVELFLGMTGVYHKFISNYQLLVEPLRRLKSKSVDFTWTSEQ
jgi:hypothetical protein